MSVKASPEPASGLGHPATIPCADVIAFPALGATPSPMKEAEMWEGLVRVMEANGRSRIEIGVAEVRRIAVMARRLAPCV